MKLLQVRLRGGPKFSISVRKFNLKKVKLGNGIEVKNTETRFGGDGQAFFVQQKQSNRYSAQVLV